MTSQTIRVLDTGTTAPPQIPEGIELRHQPALTRRPLDIDEDALRELLTERRHVVFYSQFSAQIALDLGLALEKHRLWAVGEKTAHRLSHHIGVDVQAPADQHFTGLKKALAACGEPLSIIALAIRGTHRDLEPIADDWGVDFTAIPVYQSSPTDPQIVARTYDEFDAHWMTLTSSRGARSVADALGTHRLRSLKSTGIPKIAAIGPSTAEAATQLGISPTLIAPAPDRTRLLDTIAAREGLPS